MTTSQRLAAEALALVGSRFRLHGRDPASGLDCVGVLDIALERAGCPIRLPIDYTMRSRAADRPAQVADQLGLLSANGLPVAGDILLLKVGPEQLHFVLCAGADAYVHAHAGLRRVVLSPALPDGEIVGHWRMPAPV